MGVPQASECTIDRIRSKNRLDSFLRFDGVCRSAGHDAFRIPQAFQYVRRGENQLCRVYAYRACTGRRTACNTQRHQGRIRRDRMSMRAFPRIHEGQPHTLDTNQTSNRLGDDIAVCDPAASLFDVTKRNAKPPTVGHCNSILRGRHVPPLEYTIYTPSLFERERYARSMFAP